ncbi:MAG: acyltransferase [Legionellaceae bacterium]|nr:acyltransferase [Legionellaceae bacterium]
MRLFVRLFACFMVTLLISCSTYQQMIHHASTLKACRLMCSDRLQQCAHTCQNNERNCTALANAEAAVHFNQYKHQRCVQGEIVALELQSYRDPLQCRKITCACRADYGVCTQSCKGKIHKRLQVVAPN